MGERTFKVLSSASQEELFHLQSGLDITSVRELIVHLRTMGDETFKQHVNAHKNDFSTWIRDVFRDDQLAKDIRSINDKEAMANHIEKRLLELEEKELERFGEQAKPADLQVIEENIEELLLEDKDEQAIRDALLEKGVDKNMVELLLIGRNNPYKEYYDLENVQNVEQFHKEMDELKRHIMNQVVRGNSLYDIKAFLHAQGWHDEIIDFVIYDVFKPHPNVQKVANYINHELKEKGKDIESIKRNLMHLGWKEFIIDSVIYGINDPNNSLQKILSYLEGFVEDNDQEEVKRFLLQLGWKEMEIDEAIRQREFEDIQGKLKQSFNLKGGSLLKEHCTIINYHLVIVNKKGKHLWKKILEQTKKVSLSSFKETYGELHLEEEYQYYFAKSDLKHINARERTTIKTAQYLSPTSPLLIDHHDRYLILPRIIERECIACKRAMPINHMRKITLWDDTRTHKVKKYVCDQHKDEMKSLFEETRIIQS